MNIPIQIILTWNLCFLSSIEALSLYMSNYFIVQVPDVRRGNVVFQALTPSHAPFNVRFRAAQYREKRVQLSRLKLATVVFENMRMIQQSSFRTYSYVAESLADHNFCLHVQQVLADNNFLLADMLVLPVAGFGRRYSIIGPSIYPEYIVVASDVTYLDGQISYIDGSSVDRYQGVVRLILDREQAYVIHKECDSPTYYRIVASLQATTPFGVIVGSCINPSRGDTSAHSVRASLNMLLPEEYYSRDCIVPAPFKNEAVLHLLKVNVTTSPIKYTSINDEADLFMHGPRISNFIWATYNEVAFRMDSDTPLSCYMTFMSRGDENFFGATTIIPSGLYCNYYVWSTVNYPNIEHNYVVFFSQTKHKDSLIYDGTNILNANWTRLTRTSNWSFIYMDSAAGVHEAYMSEGAPFGCYIYGTGGIVARSRHGYLTSVGLIASGINYEIVKRISKPNMTEGDLYDNDNDAAVDEELNNGIDDDGDGLIDEDLAFPKTVHGNWSQWQGWQCHGICGVGMLSKVRLCNNPTPQGYGTPCIGDGKFTGDNQSCHTGHTCPEDCQVGSYLMDCVGDCSNCENDCNKFNGSCDRCKLGWKDPVHACTTECPEMTFGFHCTQSCSLKCNKHDCLDKVRGTCPVLAKSQDLLFLFPLVLLLPVCFLPCICRRKKVVVSESENPALDLTLQLL
ncbi:uncharacterized protein LOC131958250 [Physella acuta]|uniref:uncharacterized protein LOC131958250 n=1 Tax=Physella acuta TaxID=109671 RepID=UPI0027DAD4E4|nr:uncharacterized protein LOC131958250 [Physella acuta]